MARKRVLAFELIELDKKQYDVKKTNPKYWKQDGVRKNFHFFYAPNHPEIIVAYEAEGMKQLVMETPKVVETVPERPIRDAEQASGQEEVQTPWRDLSWPLMRSKATEFTDEPIKNKEMAVQVLEQAESEGKL